MAARTELVVDRIAARRELVGVGRRVALQLPLRGRATHVAADGVDELMEARRRDRVDAEIERVLDGQRRARDARRHCRGAAARVVSVRSAGREARSGLPTARARWGRDRRIHHAERLRRHRALPLRFGQREVLHVLLGLQRARRERLVLRVLRIAGRKRIALRARSRTVRAFIAGRAPERDRAARVSVWTVIQNVPRSANGATATLFVRLFQIT